MNPGKLRNRITIQRKTKEKDSEGITQDTWTDVVSLWSAVEYLHSRRKEEMFLAGAVVDTKAIVFHCRYKQGLDSSMRVVYGSRHFDIQSIIDINEEHRYMDLVCLEVSNGG